MAEEIRHYQVNQRYRVVIERAASTKGVDGFKVEANGDELDIVEQDAKILFNWAAELTSLKQWSGLPQEIKKEVL